MLGAAVPLIEGRPGPILDLGLGAGRTYDHLCALFPDRAVFAFDFAVNAALEVLPSADQFVVGDIRDTLPFALPRIGAPAALIHNDLGLGDGLFNETVAAWLAPAIEGVARADAIVVTSFLLPFKRFAEHALPPGVATGRYHLLTLGG